jgi:hypothetical protein
MGRNFAAGGIGRRTWPRNPLTGELHAPLLFRWAFDKLKFQEKT